MQSSGALRPIVIPGEAVGGPGLKPGPGTYSEGGRVFAAQLGIRNEHEGLVSVIPLNGRYIPQRGDAVIGEVVDQGPSHWLGDINSPYPAPLHATESPWRGGVWGARPETKRRGGGPDRLLRRHGRKRRPIASHAPVGRHE